MSISIQCPSCSDRFVAEESDRGQFVKCGTCWTSVPVPGNAPVPAQAAKPLLAAVAKPVTGSAPVFSAKVVAKPVVAATILAIPVPAKLANKVDSNKNKKKPRFSERNRENEDDGEDEDRNDAPKNKKGNTGLLIGLAAVAVVLVAGCGGLGWYLLGTSGTASNSTASGGGPVLVGNSGTQNNWRAIAIGDGFSMDTPDGRISASDTKVNFGQESLNARKYVKKDNNSTIQITAIHCDLKGKAGARYTALGMMLELYALPNVKESDRGKRYIGDREVSEFVVELLGNHNHIWIAKLGDRVYGFQFQWENPEPANVLDTKEAFFRSIALTYVGIEPFGPAFGNNPNAQGPIERPWKSLPNTSGFTVSAPPGEPRNEKITAVLNGKYFTGKKYWNEDPLCQYFVFTHDIPTGTILSLQKLIEPILPFPHSIEKSEDFKVDGKPGTKWTLKHFHGGPGYGVSVRVGFRVFTFLCTNRAGIHSRPEPSHEERAELFLKSIKINFDPITADPLFDDEPWVAMAKTTGFTALAPKGTSVSDHRVGFARDEIRGTEYKCEDDTATYQLFAYEIPAGKTIDKIVTEHLDRQPILEGPKTITIDGRAAEELQYADFFKNRITMRSVKVGTRAIIVKITRKNDLVPELLYESRKAKFLRSFKIGSGGAATDPGPGGEPMPKGNGEFVKAGKILPFWASVVLPDSKEIVTASIRDATAVKPSGILRRYGLNDFKLKASYQLPLPVNRMVADEKNGRLYCVAVTAYDKNFAERELSFALGEVQIFSLNNILGGKLTELEDLKPLGVISVGGRLSGIELAPNGSQAYVSQILQGRDKAKITWKGKVSKLDIDGRKVAGEIELPDAVWSMRLSSDGSKLYAGCMPLTPVGAPLTGVARPSLLELVDTGLWKRTKALPMPGAILEIAIAGDKVLAIVSSKAEPSLVAIDEAGDVTDLTPRGEEMTSARYIRTSNDGKSVLISSGFDGTISTYYNLSLKSPTQVLKVAGGNGIDATSLGGHFLFSPDGNLAVFNSGLILDLKKSAGR